MDYIISFIDFLWNTISFLWELVVSLVKNSILLEKYLMMGMEILYELILELPGFVQPFCYLCIVVSILLVILGSVGGGKGNSD